MDHEALAESLAAQLNGVRRVLRRQVRAGLGVPELSGSQVELLRLVESSPGIGVGAAAQQLHLAGNSVSTLVNQLTEAGLLQRERDPADRRSAQLFLTAAAQHRLAAWRAARVSLLAAALAAMDPGERDALAAAIPALTHLAEELTAPGVPAPSSSASPDAAAPGLAGPGSSGPRLSGSGLAGPRSSGPGSAAPRLSGPGSSGPRVSVGGSPHPSFLGSETRRGGGDSAPGGEGESGVHSGERGGDDDGGR